MDQRVASKRKRKPLLHTFITSNSFTQESHNGGEFPYCTHFMQRVLSHQWAIRTLSTLSPEISLTRT